ncbi:MAG: hypothetical protein ACFFDH_19195, partial [Promethearchaeota archaeon]
NQNPSVHWDQKITITEDMSDYVIKSASIQVVVNATVDQDVDCPGDTLATDGGANLNQQESYDFVRFYVLVSDLSKSKVWEMAYLQPTDLGQGNPPGDDTLSDSYLIPYDEADLKYFLTSVLSSDNHNFTLTMGIRIYTADNSDTYDNDEFHELLIKSVNLTFSYEKTINQQTSISWNQIGEKVSENIPITNYTGFQVSKATLNFEYMINDTWSSSSPNSEIRVLINNIKHTESVKLSTGTQTFQDASPDGFDLTSLISDDVNISIQVFIADADFELNRTIKVSIDNFSLNITYTVDFDDYQTTLQLFLNGKDKTSSPSIDIPIGQNLTITVKYLNQTGGHITGANIELTGIVGIDHLKELTNNYSITVNTTDMGIKNPFHSLTIEATKTNFQTQPISPNIIVRPRDTEIITVSGEPTIDIDVGEDAQIAIMLNDTDNDKLIKGAIVTYTCTGLVPIPIVLTETNGIYEGVIENPSEGLYTITISAYAENYEFEDLIITLNVGEYVPQEQPDWSWVIYILIGAILGLVMIFSLYLKIWRFPPLVRKIRKVRKKIKKGRKIKPLSFQNRKELVEKIFHEPKQILKFEKTPINKEGGV